MSIAYLLKPLFDQRLAARVMSVKEGAQGDIVKSCVSERGRILVEMID